MKSAEEKTFKDQISDQVQDVVPLSDSLLRCLVPLYEWIVERNSGDDVLCPELFEQHHLEAICYYYACDRLPEPWKSRFADVYRQQSARALKLECAVREVEKLLRRHEIRFVWLKGADLGLRIYPAPGLRLLGDLDLWIHPQDTGRIRKILQADGWHAPYENTGAHHYAMRTKNGVALEPHFTLPIFDGIAPEALWAAGVCRNAAGTGLELTPEMNVLLLMQHASSGYWRRCSLAKLLLDMRFLTLRQQVDWTLVHTLAQRWKLYAPDLLFAAYPELFPDLPRQAYSPELCADFRALFSFTPEIDGHEFCMSETTRFSWQWWLQRLHGLKPVTIRVKYHLPPHGIKYLPTAYWRDLTAKFRDFWHFRHRDSNPELVRHLERIRRIQEASFK